VQGVLRKSGQQGSFIKILEQGVVEILEILERNKLVFFFNSRAAKVNLIEIPPFIVLIFDQYRLFLVLL
jgi:hypothetical protein